MTTLVCREVNRSGFMKLHRKILAAVCVLASGGCAYVSEPSNIGPRPERPAEIDAYYSKGASYQDYKEEVIYQNSDYKVKRISIITESGLVTVDYYQRPTSDENLVFVFPLLGGKNLIVDYFADYFAKRGYEAAIVHRVDDFKDPSKFQHLEEVFRAGVVRDRVAMDFFESKYNKKNFGSFGISRGAINVAVTAGVDPRLKYNVMAMGGTDLVGVFKRSNQKGIAKYIKRVMDYEHISKDEFFAKLKAMLKTDPKNLAQYIDPNNTLLMLAVFDRTVPIRYGERLRRQIGNPRTIYLLADHYTSALYTQLASVFPPVPKFSLFPLDYIESEALAFYDRSFKKKSVSPRVLPYRLLQLPFTILGELMHI